ncbi:NADH-dependent fumarate reductase [Gigaspora margarita]|uniref:NADH-dependent fumarate reductase n=1 Tax=Gigaspora margarita TaxID=4874 RepID=A0A8H4A0R8_GIGMA|nr:NADH-dependent fumarate reductase [Gigaspora margarita]
MADIEFNPNVIYNKLVNLRAKPQSSGKVANGELQPVSSLRIDVASVTKDVNRFRACDGSACFYCREWAIFIYKKNFTWMAKSITNNNVIKVDNLIDEPKKNASIIYQEFNDLILKYDDEKTRTNASDNDFENIIDNMVHKTLAWIKAPNRLYIIPDIFSNVEFDISKFISSNHDKDRDLVCILDSIEIEKSHYQFSKPHFHLLKLTNPPQQCHHTRPEWKVPTDLDLDRRVFNDLLFKEKSQNEDSLKEGLNQVWLYVTNFLTSILQIEANRDQIFGKGCLANMDNFLKEYQDESLPFKDYWAPIAEAYKKTPKSKKVNNNNNNNTSTDPVDDIDAAYRTYINNAKTVISFWEEGFIENVLINAVQFSEETQCTLLGYLVDFQSRISKIPIKDSLDDILKNYADALILVKDIKLMISKRLSIMRSDISKKSKELIQELEALDDSWNTQSQRTTQGRLEKANNKEFRKRIKKFETTVQSTRQAAVTAIGALFPVTNLASICNSCLELLLTEGEIMEAIQLEKHYKNYETTAKKFQEQREALLKDFEQGVETGRKVLAGIFGRLFLKEAWGLIAETLALKKQDAFLQSMDKGKTETIKKKKSDKDTGNGISQPTDNSVPTEVSKKNKKKKRKSSSNVTTISSNDNQSAIVQQDNHLVSQEPEPQSNEPSTSQDSCHVEEQKPLIGTITDSSLNHNNNNNDNNNNNNTNNNDNNTNNNKNNTNNNNHNNNNNNNNTNSTQSLNVENTVKHSVLDSSQSQDFPESSQTTHQHEFQDNNKSSNGENILKSPVLDSSQDLSATNPHEFQDSLQRCVSTPPGLNTNTNSLRLNQGSVAKGNHSPHEGFMDFDNFSREDLILFVQNLLNEKTQLVKTLVSMQQEVKAVTDRYTNLMEMSREREFQTFQLFEAHKKLEMDEATKYIQKLEARISQLEKNKARSINGDYMDPWNSHITGSRASVRCGNCGGQNHTSQECMTGCRYCGDPGHLSELCSSSINGTNLEI